MNDHGQLAAAPTFTFTPRKAAPLLSPRKNLGSPRLTRRDMILIAGLGVLFLVGYLAAFPRPLSGRPIFSSPRQNVGYVLDELFVSGGGFAYPERFYERLPPDISIALTPRDAASLHGAVVPKDFAGTMLAYAPLLAAWRPLVLLVTPIFAVLSGFVLVGIAARLFGRLTVLPTFLLWMTYPPMVINGSSIFMSDTLALFFVLFATLKFIDFWKERQLKALVFFALSGGAAVLIRYPSAWIVIPMMLFLLLTGRLSWRRTTIVIALFMPFVITIAEFNKLVYGSYRLTGYQIRAVLMKETVNFANRGFLTFDWGIVLTYLRLYLLKMPMVLAPEMIGLLLGLFLIRRSDDRVLFLSLLAPGVVFAIFQFPRPSYGAFSPVVNASITRYLLPVTALWLVLLVGVLYEKLHRSLFVVVVCGLLILNVGTSMLGSGGVTGRYEHATSAATLRSAILAATPPDALIATRVADKYLWPDRQTLTLSYLVHNTVPIQQRARYQWTFVPSAQRFADVARTIVSAGIPFYLQPDFYPPSSRDNEVEAYSAALLDQGLTMCRVSGTPSLLAVIPARPGERALGPQSTGQDLNQSCSPS